jgi:hypothetical protein
MPSYQFYSKEIDAAYDHGDLITVCWEPECTMHRLTHWDETVWVKHTRQSGGQYTHGICERHARLFREEIRQHFASQVA